ncbi:MAG TPA: peptidylprolyl isomerase [Gemmataceae bacterium]|nr:peptidylprolyl isomerase [Gemmataceae bacterium]
MRRILLIGGALASANVGYSQTPPQTPPAAQPAPTAAATVNGEAIPLAEVDAFIKSKFPVTPLTASQTRQMRIEIVSDMVDDLLLKQFLSKSGVKADPAEIEQHFKVLSDSLAKKGKTLADFYKETGQTEAQVRDTWTVMIQLAKYVHEQVKDEQVKEYYAANKDHFDRVEVKASHIVVRVSANAPPAERAAAKAKLELIRAEVASGKLDFADAAKKHSQCPSAPQGGDLGYISRKGGLVDEAFSKAAFAQKVGEVSPVVETDFGLHLIRVTDRKPGVPSEFEKCVEEVRETFTDDYRTELIAKLRKQGQVQITVP